MGGEIEPTLAGLFRVLRGHRRQFLVSVLAILVRHASTIGAAVCGAVAVGRAVTGHSYGAWALLAIAGVVVAAGTAWVENWVSHDLSFRVLADIRGRLYDAIARIAPAGLARRRSGDTVSLALADAEALEVFFAHTSLYVVAATVLGPTSVVALAAFRPDVAVVLALVLIVAGATPLALRRLAHRHGATARATASALATEAEETVGGLREIVAFGVQDRQRHRLATAHRAYARARAHLAYRNGVETAAAGSAVSAGVVATAWILVSELSTGAASLPAVLALLAAVASCPAPMLQLVTVTRHWSTTRASADRIGRILDTPTPVRWGVRDVTGQGPIELRLEDVHASWDDGAGCRVPAVRGVELTVRPGETLALVGPSGAGKSTIASLVSRALDPDAGRVLLDGVDVREISRDGHARCVASVPQDVYLFAETVRANVLLGAPPDAEPDDNAIWTALRAASADGLVAALPDGLDTPLSSHGGGLSGGERQRLALARALLRNARLLVLDESVSHLDPLGEREIRTALEHTRAGRTTLVIAHRPSTVLAADRIAVVDAGRIADVGTHEELTVRCTLYGQLVQPHLAAVARLTAPEP